MPHVTIHIILLVAIIVTLAFELYYMYQAQTAKDAIMGKVKQTTSTLGGIFKNIL